MPEKREWIDLKYFLWCKETKGNVIFIVSWKTKSKLRDKKINNSLRVSDDNNYLKWTRDSVKSCTCVPFLSFPFTSQHKLMSSCYFTKGDTEAW